MVPADSCRISRAPHYSGSGLVSDIGCRLRGCHPLRPGFPTGSPNLVVVFVVRPYNPGRCRNTAGLGSCAFARHYWRNHFCFLFLRVLRCFSSPGLPHPWDGTCLTQVGCPIRKSALLGIFAPVRGLSQLVTSFFASESPGILHVPFSPFLFLYLESRLFVLLLTFRFVVAELFPQLAGACAPA